MKYISILSYAFAFLFLYSQLSMAKDVASDDSLYTREYISQIYIAEPERALKLLDEAENRGTMLPYLISDLRSMAYRNMYMNKLAFDYARKSYVLDSVSQNNPEHLLQMTIALAELNLLKDKMILRLKGNYVYVSVKMKGCSLEKKEVTNILIRPSGYCKILKTGKGRPCCRIFMG